MMCSQNRESAVGVFWCDDCDYADFYVEGLVYFGALDVFVLGDYGEYGSRRSCILVELGHQFVWDDALEVVCELIVCDVVECPNLGFCGQCEAILGVDAGRFEEFLVECVIEFFDVIGEIVLIHF